MCYHRPNTSFHDCQLMAKLFHLHPSPFQTPFQIMWKQILGILFHPYVFEHVHVSLKKKALLKITIVPLSYQTLGSQSSFSITKYSITVEIAPIIL